MKPSAPSLLLAALASTASLPGAITPVQTLAFEGFDVGTSTNFGSGLASSFASIPLDGFTQFDPSLGTLTGVAVSIELSGLADLGLWGYAEGDEVPDTFTLYLDTFSSNLQAGIVYGPTGGPAGGSSLYLVAGSFQSLPSLGVFDEDGSNFSDFESEPPTFSYQEYTSAYFGPEPASDVLPADASYFYAPDFVGNGTVTGLEVFIYIEVYDSDLTVANLSPTSAGFDLTVYLDGANVNLQYLYDDGLTPIPEPRALGALLGLGLLAAVGLRRRR